MSFGQTADAASGEQHRINPLCDRLVEYMDVSRGGVLSIPIGDLLVTWTQAPSPEQSTQELLPFIDSISLATEDLIAPASSASSAAGGAEAAGLGTSPSQHQSIDSSTHEESVDLQVDYRNGKDKATMKASFRHLHIARGSDIHASVG